MGALFGECVLNRESHYIRRWRLIALGYTLINSPSHIKRNLDFSSS